MSEHKDDEMSLVDHLEELRWRLIKSIAAVVICTMIMFAFARPALRVLTDPIEKANSGTQSPIELVLHVTPDGSLRADGLPPGTTVENLARKQLRLVIDPDPATSRTEALTLTIGQETTQSLRYTSPIDLFMIPFKVALIMGLLMSLPIILWQIWSFVQPGLHNNEERVVKPLLAGAVIMFPLGAGFAYLMIKLILVVMQTYRVEGIEMMYDAGKYLGLMTTMMLIFGVIFEMPLVMAIAARIGLVTPEMLRRYRRVAIVVMAVASAVLTPADPWSMLAAFFPMLALYELSIVLAKPMAYQHRREVNRKKVE